MVGASSWAMIEVDYHRIIHLMFGRGVAYGTTEQHTITGLSEVIIPFETYQINPQIKDGVILYIIQKQCTRKRCYMTSPLPAEAQPCTLGCWGTGMEVWLISVRNQTDYLYSP